MGNWNDTLKEIDAETKALGGRAARGQAFDNVRRRHLARLHQHTNRNVIAYYSGWLQKPGQTGLGINDEDKGGFMSAVHGLDRTKGLDLILHTPGGSIAATQSIVNYLHKMFGNDIRAIIPQIAMSAGTMIALSCKSIVMGAHSNIGPIDPQLNDIPAYGVIQEFRRAVRSVKNDPATAFVWQPIIGQYRPTFLSQCENAVRLSNEFVLDQLMTVMFAGDPQADEKARVIVRRLSSYTTNKTHERHIHLEDCEEVGIVVERLEDDADLQDLVLTVHHAYTLTLANSSSSKFIENHNGSAFVKSQAMAVQQMSPVRFGPLPQAAPVPAP